MVYPKSEPDTGSPSQELRGFHLQDQLIRAAGFVVRARPPGEPPVWRRNGRDYLQATAERIALREAREKAEAARVAVG